MTNHKEFDQFIVRNAVEPSEVYGNFHWLVAAQEFVQHATLPPVDIEIVHVRITHTFTVVQSI